MVHIAAGVVDHQFGVGLRDGANLKVALFSTHSQSSAPVRLNSAVCPSPPTQWLLVGPTRPARGFVLDHPKQRLAVPAPARREPAARLNRLRRRAGRHGSRGTEPAKHKIVRAKNAHEASRRRESPCPSFLTLGSEA